MLDYSIGEVESLVFKAYRGAGFSWGMAQEAGQAAAWMSMNRMSAVEQFAGLLPEIDGVPGSQLVPLIHESGSWSNAIGRLCPVTAGTAYADCAADLPGTAVVIENVLQPLIMLPFVSQTGPVAEVTIGAHRYLCGGNVCACLQGQSESPSVITCGSVRIAATDGCSVKNRASLARRAIVNPRAADILGRYAHRTYVPASEASRLAGAGAGLLDND